MRLSKIKDCNKCASSILYGDILQCNSLNYDCRKKFKEEGSYYACKCSEYNEGKAGRAGLINQNNGLKFILAGNSEFILHSTKTDDDFRFKLTKQKSKDKENEFIYFVNKIVNKESIYAGIIIFNKETSLFEFKQGNKGNISSLDICVRSLIFVLNKLYKGETVGNLELYHIGKCGCCESRLVVIGNEETGLCKMCNKTVKIELGD